MKTLLSSSWVLSIKKIKIPRLLLTVIAVILTIFVLGFMVWRQKDILFTYNWHIRLLPVLYSFIMYGVTLVLVSFTWSLIVKSYGSGFSTITNMRHFLMTNLGKRLPGTVWYVAWRVQIYRQENFSASFTSLVSGVELAVLIVSGVFVSLICAIPLLNSITSLWIWAVLLLVVGLMLLHPKIQSYLLGKLGIQPRRIKLRQVAAWIVLHVFVWVFGGIVLFCVCNIFIDVPLNNLGHIIGIWSIVGFLSFLLFFFPTNFGFNEIGISFLLSQIMPSPIAVLVALSSRILTTLYDILFALIALGFGDWQQGKKINF